jgi:KDO2-lipid IV(A) lauroyltransferase
MAEKVGRLLVVLVPWQRRKAVRNLRVAFGKEMDAEQMNLVIERMSVNVVKNFFESFYFASDYRQKVDHIMELRGREHLDAALSQGKGVITVSAHLGNFMVMGIQFFKEGYPFHVVIKDPDDWRGGRLSRKLRGRMDQKFIAIRPVREGLRRINRALKGNEIVCLIADEYKRSSNVQIEFFGQAAPTAAGPAVLSLRTGAPIVPVFIIREEDDIHRIFIEPPLNVTKTGNLDRDVRSIAVAFTEAIESYVRRYPDQWLWFNRRWRSPSKRVRGRRQAMGEA